MNLLQINLCNKSILFKDLVFDTISLKMFKSSVGVINDLVVIAQ